MAAPTQATPAPEALFEARRTSRRAFLRKAGLTLAVGLGGSLALAKPAWAQSAHCCRDSACASQLPGCPSQNQYRCYDCDGSQCCGCYDFGGVQCKYNLGCGGCGAAPQH